MHLKSQSLPISPHTCDCQCDWYRCVWCTCACPRWQGHIFHTYKSCDPIYAHWGQPWTELEKRMRVLRKSSSRATLITLTWFATHITYVGLVVTLLVSLNLICRPNVGTLGALGVTTSRVLKQNVSPLFMLVLRRKVAKVSQSCQPKDFQIVFYP